MGNDLRITKKTIIWTPEMEQRVLELVSTGTTWAKIAESLGVSVSAVFSHRRRNNDFHEAILRAQEMGFEVDADRLKTAHDDIPDPMKARLYSENTRWLLARRAAHKYGDRLDITTNRTIDIGKALSDARARAGLSIGHVSDDAIDTVGQVVGEIAESSQAEGNNEPVNVGDIDDLL